MDFYYNVRTVLHSTCGNYWTRVAGAIIHDQLIHDHTEVSDCVRVKNMIH